jgi:hypothetical protein
MQLQKAAGGLIRLSCGCIARMDDETRERIVVACTEVAMMMEELSVKALGAAEMEAGDLHALVSEISSSLMTALIVLQRT